ncbi:MAG: DUF3179 domain-containing protein [Bacteroidetes bacterium]|jgi:hypothetical protein|nr:DUF3179 domain-containing protein [Bacteroidota bacterium]
MTLSCGRRLSLSIGLGLLGLIVLVLAGCDSTSGPSSGSGLFEDPSSDACDIPASNLVSGGVPKDGIPALTDPTFVDPGASQASYLDASSRVIGLVVDGEAYAIPHNILWHHEIANLNFESIQLAVTYCPLTGSSLAFDRAVIDGGEFGVSGLLFNNNLTMYDRTSQESLWPQMNREAGCGPRSGSDLTMYPIMETTWDGWQALYPETQVVSGQTGFNRNYQPSGYPYGNYEEPNNDRLLFSAPIDDRRPPKERVLGVPGTSEPSRSAGVAYPFGELNDGTPVTVVNDDVADGPIVVLWSQAAQGAMAFRPVVDGQLTTFEDRNGEIVDVATESVWNVRGEAISGPMQGAQLEPVRQTYVAFWFAWALFQPETTLYTN